jgi:hypothetical protein
VGVDDVEVVERRTLEGHVVEVVLATPDERFAVRVVPGQGPSAHLLTCTADQPARPPAYDLAGIERR